MKKFVLTLLASVLIGTSVNAQEAKCGSCKKQDKAQHKTEMMARSSVWMRLRKPRFWNSTRILN